MMNRNALRTALARMEERLAATRNNLLLAERSLGDRPKPKPSGGGPRRGITVAG